MMKTGLKDCLTPIRVVMVETSHPGNIGAAARAMKTMGLSQLVLVRPKVFPDDLATAMASGAADVLSQARVVDSLTEALAGCTVVIGTSARERSSAWPQVDARDAASLLLNATQSGDAVALVFGRENSGLTNVELDLCHYLGHVPTNPEYGVLNIAMGIQIFSYECWVQAQSRLGKESKIWRRKTATADELVMFYDHLQQTLLDIGYLDPEKNDHFMRRLKRLFHRATLEAKELTILRGVLRSMQRVGRLALQKKEQL